MRHIWVMIGSDSDLPQCTKGFEYLLSAQQEGRASVDKVITASIHRNTEDVLQILSTAASWAARKELDVLIIGAGWANHLTGTSDAYLRNTLHDKNITIVGVAFEDKKTPANTAAAILSITQVPDTQVVFKGVGESGFLDACEYAVEGVLPIVVAKDIVPFTQRSLQEASQAALDKIRAGKE